MFKIESYVTPILLSYVDKYVRDFKPADAQVSLWGGGVVLHNLVLKADVLQQELALPFTLVSGRIHELLIQVPWTKIMSEPIVVTIDTIECVLSLNPPPAPPEETPQPDSPSHRPQMVETPPGYMQALVRRIVSNISLRVHHLIVKYVQDDIVMSLNVKHLDVDSSGPDWLPAFADIEQHLPVVRRLVRLDNLTLCLDRSDADGKIRFYQEPLLYRCQLELRVLTKLIAANTRRASSLSIQLRSSKLAWSVTSEQLVLLLRLIKELGTEKAKVPPPSPNASIMNQIPLHTSSSHNTEPAQSGSWSEWAWSWMPTWMDKEGAVEESVSFAGSTPISFSAYIDEVSLIFKVMESDGNNRKRSRGVIEMIASHFAIKSYFSFPTTVQMKFGVRTLTIRSQGKCVCGHLDFNAVQQKPTIYLSKIESTETEEQWEWPEEDIADEVVKTDDTAQDGDIDEQDMARETPGSPEPEHNDLNQSVPLQLGNKNCQDHSEFWRNMAPVVSFDYVHERSPPLYSIDPYDNPPTDFQHSDWVENCSLKIKIEAMELNICMGLVHRMAALLSILKNLPYGRSEELPMRVLTVEECEALYDNLPQRRLIAVTKGVHVRIIPWDHSLIEKPMPPPLILDIYIPKTVVLLNTPLYPHRVCSAACQLPDDAGPVWQGARLHLTVLVLDAQAGVCSLTDSQPRLCARTDFRFVIHRLLNEYLFVRRESVLYSYSIKIREINVFGSAVRLRAAWEIMESLIKARDSLPLRHSELAKKAVNDEDEVAIDLSFEEISFRSFLTKNVNTYSFTLHSARGTVHHEPKGEKMKQAWIFSAPDMTSTSRCTERKSRPDITIIHVISHPIIPLRQ